MLGDFQQIRHTNNLSHEAFKSDPGPNSDYKYSAVDAIRAERLLSSFHDQSEDFHPVANDTIGVVRNFLFPEGVTRQLGTLAPLTFFTTGTRLVEELLTPWAIFPRNAYIRN